jgi:pullulanase
MSCHDNMTLWDILTLSCPDSTAEELLMRNRLGIGVLMISQGTPFWQAGEEMLRTKGGDHNSYMSGDAVNNINWDVLSAGSNEYAAMEYYQGLIEMRKAYEIFRSTDSSVVSFTDLPDGALVVSFKDAKGNEALAVINPTAEAISHTLAGEWKLIVDATRSGSEVLSVETGTISVAACSIMIFVK